MRLSTQIAIEYALCLTALAGAWGLMCYGIYVLLTYLAFGEII
jgi:hypothetical protein